MVKTQPLGPGVQNDGGCYVCGAPRTSDDHVPPRAFFPKFKDCGAELRRNIIKVPSCAAHNEAASLDDQYAAYIMIVHFKANDVARRQFFTNFMRAAKRKPALMAIFRNARPVAVREPGTGLSRGAFEVDPIRFDRAMAKIARGLHFHLTGQRIDEGEKLHVYSPELYPDETLAPSPYEAVEPQLADPRFHWSPLFSGHPDISPRRAENGLARRPREGIGSACQSGRSPQGDGCLADLGRRLGVMPE